MTAHPPLCARFAPFPAPQAAHDWLECPYAHKGEKAARRDPRTHTHMAVICPDIRRVSGHSVWVGGGGIPWHLSPARPEAPGWQRGAAWHAADTRPQGPARAARPARAAQRGAVAAACAPCATPKISQPSPTAHAAATRAERPLPAWRQLPLCPQRL
jgi:hypothetical protein